ncbi:transcription factor aflr [Fusarium longipes]|uniref:Transcription factor aflr n=1 Tax=Fusarium longipes TaxID=694270 RepID=A0A395T7J1_9HYPO|nr:transcription factor aflr [Fusarium longipes]
MASANNNRTSSTPRQAMPRKPQKPLKLKASCDFCAMSKVKCDRGQPQCLRCIRNEVVCHYSESRRIGKARRIFGTTGSGSKQHSISTQEPWSQQSVQQGHMMHDTTESPDYPISVDEFDEETMVFMHESNMTSDISTMPSYLDLMKESDRSPNRQNASLDDMDFLTSQFPEFMQGIFEGQALQTMENEGTIHVNPNSQLPLSPSCPPEGHPRVCNGAGTTYKSKKDCMELACMTIKTLHMPAEPCVLSNDDAKNADIFRSIDSTLKASRSARETVGQILACPCACSWNLLYLLVLITRQLIGTYSSLLEHQLSTPTSSLSSASSTKELVTSSTEARSKVFDITMTIGGYVLDGESKMKVITQVIRSQLDDMGGLINSLASRSAETTIEEPAALCWKGLIDSLQRCRERALESAA